MVTASQLGLADFPAGENDSITDVDGVQVGHATLIDGEGALRVGEGPVRTGVTIVSPRADDPFEHPLFASYHRLNGNGELTGASWMQESGLLTSPIALTNTHSVGAVRDALIRNTARRTGERGERWHLPVVAETWDGVLNDIMGQHVTADHVDQALTSLSSGPVTVGNVGGGTGMICHGFKGGIGSSSRVARLGGSEHTVGVLVQANHGRRHRLRFGSLALGALIGPDVVPEPPGPENAGAGSVIVIVATDAPLLPHQLNRLAQRAGLGIARAGGTGEHTSGDIFVAFSTANGDIPPDYLGARSRPYSVEVLHNSEITLLFDAVIEATEAAVLSALLGAETMSGAEGRTAHALTHDLIESALARRETPGKAHP
ncbi:MAG TPA: P1 family peptidase [Terrimesophilobacter sp.]|nr:P1 family peptidase [Terrimesophilobacter sp.]HRP99198.1 P1 family peptidase [Terrimesophilobacter sp.]